MTLASYRARLTPDGPEQMWWSLRCLDTVLSATLDDEKPTNEELDLALDCFVRLATADFLWAIERLRDRSLGYPLMWLLTKERLLAVLPRVVLDDKKDEALLRAGLLIECGKNRNRPDDEPIEIWQLAWTELQRIAEGARDEEWQATALDVTARVAYDVYRELAVKELASLEGDAFYTAYFLADAMNAATRHKDWATFDAYARTFRGLPEAVQHEHVLGSILNVEGHRALDAGDLVAAEQAMRALVDLAPSVEYLGNPELSSFPGRLMEQKLVPELCATFSELVKRRDWRLLDEKK